MSTSAEALRSIRLFEGLSDAVLAELAAAMPTRDLQPGDSVGHVGDSARCLGVVLAGAIDVFADAATRVTQGQIPTGGSYGAWTFLGGGSRSGDLAAALSLPSTIVGELGEEHFEAIASRHRGVRETVLRNTVTELRSLELARAVRNGWGITDPAAIASLATLAVVRDIAAGQVLVREGDTASSAYLILSGSFRVAGQADGLLTTTDSMLPTLGPGQLVGERALLENGVRSATLVAMRESRVAEFETETFQALCLDHPEVLLRTVGELLRRHDSMIRPQAPKGKRLALIGDGNADVIEFARRLASSFPHPLVVVDAQDAANAVGLSDHVEAAVAELNSGRLETWLDGRAEESAWLLLVADPRDQRWTAACLSLGDHIVALAEKFGVIPNRHPVWPGGTPALQPTTLVLLHPATTVIPSDTSRVLQHLPADAHLHVRIDRDDDVARVARTLAGVPYGLVLSGGGARGFAHLGAIQAMRELGIPCDLVGGTSIGAVMAVYQGMDMSIEEQIAQTEVGFHGLLDYTLPVVSLLKGKRTSERIQRHVGEHTIEDLWLPFFCISTNLSTNDMKIHDRGLVATAVRASLALPGIFPPVHDGEHFLVDGGVLNNFPLDVMRSRNPFGKVIAVDVAANMSLEALGNFGLQLSGWRAAASMIRRKPLAPTIATTLVRTSVIGSARDRDRYLRMRYADLHMELTLKECGLLDFGAVRSVAHYGYQAARPQLAAWWKQ